MKKRLKVGLAVFGAMIILVGLLIAYACHGATLTFERHRREVAEKIAGIRARTYSSPPIWGDAEPGNAWERCLRVVEDIGSLPAREREELTRLSFGESDLWLFVGVNQKYPKYRSLIERLKMSLRAGEVVPSYRYEEGMGLDLSEPLKLVFGSRFLVALARWLHHVGRDGEALELLVMNLVLVQDLSRGAPILGALVASMGEVTGAEAGRELLSAQALDPADLARFARRLDFLERVHPRVGEALAAEDVTLRQSVLRTDMDIFVERLLARPPSWRHLFSGRRVRAQALDELAGLFQALEAFDRLPPPDAWKLAGRLVAVAVAGGNSLVEGLVPAVGKSYESMARSRVSSTLLRVATAIAWYEQERGESPARLEDLVPRYIAHIPVCPFTGAPLRYAPGKVWAEGGDAVWTVGRR